MPIIKLAKIAVWGLDGEQAAIEHKIERQTEKAMGKAGGSMSLPACPVCAGATEFLGNESGTGKSWFACRVCMPNQVFSLELTESPRFGFEAKA